MTTKIISLDHFAGLFQDMLSVTRSDGKHLTTIGVHPDFGRLSFIQLDPMSGDGVMTIVDPTARYVPLPGELTARERDALEHQSKLAA